ncbi:MAG TPA: hypothetical protein VKV15_24035 [Bryobacteraceae bacterium]|nr:hypothetical protein [Bryobacteraceae bacterium]
MLVWRSVSIVICGLIAIACCAAANPQIQIERPILSQYDDGPSVPANYEFLPGDTIFFSCRLLGYQVRETDDTRKVQLHYRIDVRDPFGVPLAEPKAGVISTQLSPEDKHWAPKVRDTIIIPAFAPAGNYRISIEAVDDLDNSRSSLDTTFRVGGHAIRANGALTIQNFRFLRREDDRQPLQIPAYGPGDTLWARFDITGFKLGEKNRLDVDYGLSVLRPTGEVVYSQPVAATEKTESFYPQRWVPGVLSLNLGKDLKPAHYTLVLTAHDRVGEQTCEIREIFDVE